MADAPTPAGTRRPGGRTARVRADVHQAVAELLRDESAGELTLAKVAAQSGVHVGTLYRRWGTLDAIVLDALSERIASQSPMPDTGTLRGDLARYAERVVEDLSGPEGLMFLRALLAVRTASGQAEPPPAITQRFGDLQTVLDRAAARGEAALDAQDVFELLVAPLLAGLLFDPEAEGAAAIPRLLDRIERLAR